MRLVKNMLLVILFLFPTHFYGQSKKVTINLTNVKIEKIFSEIESLSDFKFLYNHRKINTDQLVSVNANNQPIGDILKNIFNETKIYFLVKNKHIILKISKPVTRQSELLKRRKSIDIEGLIVNEQGEPVPYTTIYIKGTSKGVNSDINGSFKLKVSTGDLLKISSIGYKSIDKTISSGDIDTGQIRILMKTEVAELNEVVVTGYQKLDKARVTGSFSKLGVKELENKVEYDIREKIASEIPGLYINSRGEIEIRGVGTLFGDSTPLIVVDGFPIMQEVEVADEFTQFIGGNRSLYEGQGGQLEWGSSKSGGLAGLKPENIESITALKDAAATSIYGVRAANGVIVIETKKGRAYKKPVIEFSTYTTIGSKPNLNYTDPLSAAEAVDYELAHYENSEDYLAVEGLIARNADWQVTDVGAQQLLYLKGVITKDERDRRLDLLRTNNFYKQFKDLILQNSFNQNYNLSISGSSDTHNYIMSVGYDKNQDYYYRNEKQRYTLNLSDDLTISNKLNLHLGIHTTFINDQQNGLNSFQAFYDHTPYQNIVDADGETVDMFAEITENRPRRAALIFTTPVRGMSREFYEQNGYLDYKYNILDEVNANDYFKKNFTSRYHGNLSYEIFKDFIFSNKFQYEVTRLKSRNHLPLAKYQTRHTINRFSELLPNGTLKNHLPVGGINATTTDFNKAITFTSSLEVKKEIGSGFFNGFVGFEIRKEVLEREYLKIYGYDDKLLINDAAWGDVVPLNNGTNGALPTFDDLIKQSGFDFRDVSYLSNFGYAYDSKYNITFSGRIDQSNLFGADIKYNPLWSTGLGWNIHNESWFNSNLLDRLTLTTTYGISGKVDRSSSKFLVGDYGVESSLIDNDPTIRISNAPNSQLNYEKTSIFNARIDLTMFDNRLNMALEFYQKNNKDILAPIPVDETSGFVTAILNYASIKNKGYDILIDALIVDRKLKYRSSLSFSNVSSIVTNLETNYPSAFSLVSGKYSVGNDVSHLSSYQFAGFNDVGRAQIYGPDLDGDGNPDLYISNANMRDENFIVNNGVRNPPIFGNLGQNFEYKNWRLDMGFAYKFGHVFRPIVSNVSTAHWGVGKNGPSSLLNYWTVDNQGAKYPALPNRANEANDEYFYSDANVANASSVKLRYVTVGYQTPEEIATKLGVSELRINAQFKNVAAWFANDYKIDPDVHAGINGTPISFPDPFSFTLGLNATFK